MGQSELTAYNMFTVGDSSKTNFQEIDYLKNSRIDQKNYGTNLARSPSNIFDDSVDSNFSFDGDTKGSIKGEFLIIFRNALPLTLTFLMQISISSVTVLFAGRLGALFLGAVSVANVTYTVTSVVFTGMATCLDTLCPQAFGAANYQLVSLYFQKGIVLSLVIAIPICLLWGFSAPLLSWMLNDEAIVEIASKYLKLMIFTIPGQILFENGKRYLQAQGDFKTGQYILLICSPFNVLSNHILINKLGWGYIGSPISCAFTYSLMGFLILFKIYKKSTSTEERNCWQGPSFEIFQDWKPMINLAVPGVIMIEAEFLAFEMLTVLSARIGTLTLAAQSVASCIQALTFQIPFAVGVAASNRIAHHIGRGNIRDCNTATRCTIVLFGSLLGIFNFSLFMFARYPICRIFTNDTEVISATMKLLPIIGLNQLWDVFNVLSAACLRAQGRQVIGGYLNILAYYVVGIPMALLLGFNLEMGARGFWIGLGLGIFVLAISELFFVCHSDWNRILIQSKRFHGGCRCSTPCDVVHLASVRNY